MKLAYFDCPAGAGGDMILAALLDAGLPEAALREGLETLHLDTCQLEVRKVTKSGFRATHARVRLQQDSPARKLADIEAIIRSSDLEPAVSEKALKMFRRLAGVEAAIHGKDISEVHLHELSGDDTIVDVTGALLGLQLLGIEQVVVSPLPLGRGFVDAAHGRLPLPAPATLELLQGAAVYGSPLEAELVTPTAALIFSEVANSFGAIPPMLLQSIGYGAGTLNLPEPNILRVLLGSTPPEPASATLQSMCLLETNLDDFNPQFYEPLMGHLYQAGAADVFLTPVQMKKNRPGTLLSVLCRPEQADSIERVLFVETSTLGVRRETVERRSLPRRTEVVHTRWGSVQIKVADLGSGRLKAAPEYEDCRTLAEKHQVPVKDVYLEAQQQCLQWSSPAQEIPPAPNHTGES